MCRHISWGQKNLIPLGRSYPLVATHPIPPYHLPPAHFTYLHCLPEPGSHLSLQPLGGCCLRTQPTVILQSAFTVLVSLLFPIPPLTPELHREPLAILPTCLLHARLS